MKSLLIMMCCLMCGLMAFGQQSFAQLQLADSITAAKSELVDFDNDGLLDIMLLMTSETQRSYVGFVRGDTVNTPSQIEGIVEIVAPASYSITDYDWNNTMDLLISGEEHGAERVILYRNDGNFNVTKVPVDLPNFNMIRFADFDSDGITEIVLSDDATTKILQRTTADQWKIVHDSLNIACTAIEILDANGDGLTDLFVSGKLGNGQSQSWLLINNDDFYLTPSLTLSLSGITAVGDLDHDGFFDILLFGTETDGDVFSKRLYRQEDGYAADDYPIVIKSGSLLIADFNSDGLADISYRGDNPNGNAVNEIRYSNSTTQALAVSGLVDQRFGDVDRDGVLDVVGVTAENNQLTVALAKLANSGINASPGAATDALAVRIFDRVFLYWQKPSDDHTNKQVLTYDLILEGTDNHIAGEFDLIHGKRLTVTHGNNGPLNFRLLNNVKSDDLKFAIQTIDNAFHAGPLCKGTLAESPECVSLSKDSLTACSKESLSLRAPNDAHWFSFSRGYLGSAKEIDLISATDDSVFYYIPGANNQCGLIRAWSIKVKNDTMKVSRDVKYACEGSSINFQVEPGWESVTWSSDLKGSLGTGNSLQFSASGSDTVRLTATDGGCTIVRNTAVRISQPALQVGADQYKIAKGTDVRLAASGAQRYHWTPSVGLSAVDIPDPIASPVQTTQYIVTGFDSLGCSAQLSVSIVVEEMGFIPTLFSPNSDGQNDQLKVYGLVSATHFSLSIFNREGALVYKTSDLAEASTSGWDGNKNGTAQPSGVYFWKVEGELSTGRVLLNGKNSGSVVLVR